jgi:hypothetical protein
MAPRTIDPEVETDELEIELIASPAEPVSRSAAVQESPVSAIGVLAAAVALVGALVLVGNDPRAERQDHPPEEQAETDRGSAAQRQSNAPTVVVDPPDDLRDGQSLTVTGTGFRPETTISLTQCVLGLFEPVSNCYQARHLDLEITDDTGQFTTEVPAHRHLTTDGGVLDCAALSWGRCAIVVTADEAESTGSTRFAGARQLRFADSPEPRPPDPTSEDPAGQRPQSVPAPSSRGQSLTVSVSSRSGLGDGEPVTLRLRHGEPRSRVQIELCDQEAPLGASCPLIAAYDLNSFGAGAVDVRVPRLTRSHDHGDLVDCAGGCRLRLVAENSATDTSVTFDPAHDFLDDAELEIDGDTLTPGHPVSVTGSGFVPLTSFDAFVCSRPVDRDEGFWVDPVNWCGWPPAGLWATEPSMTPDGYFRATLIPPTTVDLLSWTGPHNCLMQDCWLVVTTGRALGTTPIASARLVYDEVAS